MKLVGLRLFSGAIGIDFILGYLFLCVFLCYFFNRGRRVGYRVCFRVSEGGIWKRSFFIFLDILYF